MSLKVSGNLALTSAGYTGGLTVTGIGPDQKTFTANAIGGTTINVDLVDGFWKFYVAGWTGAAPFDGEVHCGSLEVNLTSEKTTVDIQASAANCASSTFTNGVADLSDATNGFQMLQVFSCSSHYDNGAPITASTSIPSILSGFCFSGSQPMDLKQKPGAIKISILGKGPAGEPGTSIDSACIVYAGNYVDTLLRIPTSKIPFRFSLYEDINCQKLAVIHDFRSGIQSAAVENGIVLNPHQSSANALFVPYTISKSALSPLYDKLPWITCNGGNFCPVFPAIIESADYIISAGQASSHKGLLITRDPNMSCSNMTFSNFVGLNTPSTGDCSEDEDGVFLKVSETTGGGCQAASSCSFDLTMPPASAVTKQVRSDTTIAYSTYNDVARYLGGNPIPSISNSLDAFEETPYSYGNLDDVRSDLGPDGVMGIFGGVACASLPTEPKIVSVLDEGQLKVVKVTARNSTAAIPKQICDHLNPAAASCTGSMVTFDKQIVFRMLTNSGYVTMMNMHLKCGVKVGMIESFHFDNEQGEYRDEQNLVFWNTENESKARYENYHREVTHSDFNRADLIETRHNFVHVMKRTAQSDYYIFTADFESKKDGTEINESLQRKEITANTAVGDDLAVLGMSIRMNKDANTVKSIFNMPGTFPYQEISFLSSLMKGSPMNAFMNLDANIDVFKESSTSKVFAFVDGQNNIKARIHDGTSWSEQAITSTDSSVPRIHKQNNELYVAYLTPSSPIGTVANIQLVMLDLTGNSLSTPLTLSAGSGVSGLAIARASAATKVDVFWSNFDSIYFLQKDALGSGDGPTPNYISGTDVIVANSLKVVPLPGSATEYLLVWMAQVSTNYVVRSTVYDSAEPIPSSRYYPVQTLSGQILPSDQPSNFSLFSDGSKAYYSWQTNGTPTPTHHVAMTGTTPSAVLTEVSTGVQSLTNSVESGCADSLQFNNTGACPAGLFPGPTPFKPIKNGFSTDFKSLNPSVFNNLFTPIGTFRNIE